MNNTKPFLKWAGGKTQLLSKIIEFLPYDIENYKYYIEPFVGAGALFFYFARQNYFESYIINDINSKLINLYISIRDNVEELINELYKLKDNYFKFSDLTDKEKYFYLIRDKFNSNDFNTINESAMFIFLNKTCFNGLYRENSKGFFNVPFGKYISPSIFDKFQLIDINELLNTKNRFGKFKIEILNISYEKIAIDNPYKTFMYLDPPYRPITKNGFTAYSKSKFNDIMQIELSEFYKNGSLNDIKIMLSNSDPSNLDENDNFFEVLYKDFEIKKVSAKRNINSNGNARNAINELIILNY